MVSDATLGCQQVVSAMRWYWLTEVYMWVRAQTKPFDSFMLGILASSRYAYRGVADAGGVHLIAPGS